MKSGTESKLKFKTLKRKLGLTHWECVGLLESLWMAAYQNAPDGDIGRLTNEEIAACIEWSESPDELIAALIEMRWLDEDTQYRLIVHDWSHHVANYLAGAYKTHKKQFADEVAKRRLLGELPSRVPSEPPANLPSSLPSDLPPIQSNPSQSNPILTNSIQTRISGACADSVFGKITTDLLRDTDGLLAWLKEAAATPKPILNDTEADRLNVLGIAVRALEKGKNPAALFISLVRNRDWGKITHPQENAARDRLREHRGHSVRGSNVNAGAVSMVEAMRAKRRELEDAKEEIQ